MKSKIQQKIIEPYVKLQLPKTKLQKKIYNQTFRQNYKLSFYQKAFDFLYTNNISGSYFEFGIHRARTFRFALYESYMRDLEMDFFGFDSFAGLPNVKNYESQNKFFKGGELKTSILDFKKLIKPFVKKRNIEIIEGFYAKSLNKTLVNNYKKRKIKLSMINIDCDLNQSVKESLNFALQFIQNGTVLYIDDYYLSHKGHPLKGNPKIVKDLLKKYKIIYEPWHICGSSGKSFLLYKK
jgi:O-methyltransferase